MATTKTQFKQLTSTYHCTWEIIKNIQIIWSVTIAELDKYVFYTVIRVQMYTNYYLDPYIVYYVSVWTVISNLTLIVCVSTVTWIHLLFHW